MEMEEYHDDERAKEALDEELKKIIDEITQDAKLVVEDYLKNPSVMSGSAEIHIHEDSPWLDENKSFIPLTKKRKKNVN